MSGCSSQLPDNLAPVDLSGRKARAVATTSMIADLVRNVGGEHVEVSQLMPAGVDPHKYNASAGDVQKMQQADIIFYNGLHLEGKMSDVFEQMGRRVRTVAITRTLEPGQLRVADDDYEGAHDPHIWFDVKLWMKAVDCVRDALIELDPTHGDTYRTNAEIYAKKLAVLDEEVRQKIKELPESRRKLVTAHDAFGYFGRAYGFQVRGLQGVSTNDEPNTRRVQELAQYLAENKIPAIFGETSVPDKSMEAVQQATRKGWKHEVKFLGGQLYSDSLGEEGTPGDTYAGMIRHNVEVIVNALK